MVNTPTPGRSYTAAIVTYRRAASLEIVLDGLLNQSIPPALTVVADNDPEQSARDVVRAAQRRWPNEIVYAPVGENLGPAGGWAHAVSVAASRPNQRGAWVLVIDDDDPIEAPTLVEGLIDTATDQGVAGIGLRGARWHHRSARLRRFDVPEGTVAKIDYLAGNGAPLYSWAAIDRVGFFKPDLFFGFEDLDFGLRLRKAGWTLLVAPRPSLQEVADTGSVRTSWREYYKARALLWILREHMGSYAILLTLIRSIILGGIRLLIVERQPELLKARLLGAWDGLRGRLGVRRYTPGSNPPKLP